MAVPMSCMISEASLKDETDVRQGCFKLLCTVYMCLLYPLPLSVKARSPLASIRLNSSPPSILTQKQNVRKDTANRIKSIYYKDAIMILTTPSQRRALSSPCARFHIN